MDKYIFKILENNSRVIVPEFGAFIVKQRNPLTIVFNEFLQYNDGMLVDNVSKSEGISRDDAKDKIDGFVKDVNAKLNRGEKYPISGLGVLIKSGSGKISLEVTGETGDAEDLPKDSATAADSKKPADKKSEPKIEETKAAEPKKSEAKPAKDTKATEPEKQEPTRKPKESPPSAPTTKSEEQTKEQRRPSEPSTEKEKVPGNVSPEKDSLSAASEKESPKAPASSAKSKLSEKTSAAPSRPESKPEKKASGSSTASSYKHEFESTEAGKRKRSTLILWIALIVLVNGGIFAFFYQRGDLDGLFGGNGDVEELSPLIDQEETPSDIEETGEMTPMIEQDAEQTEPSTAQQPPVETKTPKKEERVFTGKRYYVVAGVFSVEQNADNLVDELISEGYDAEKFGKVGNLHAVSYGVFSQYGDAQRFLAEIKADKNPDAWIKVVN